MGREAADNSSLSYRYSGETLVVVVVVVAIIVVEEEQVEESADKKFDETFISARSRYQVSFTDNPRNRLTLMSRFHAR